MATVTIGRRMTREFHQMLATESIRTIYQPIVSLSQDAILGYEALSRGPIPRLSSPATMFELADKESLGPTLDRACCRRAIQNFPYHSDESLLLFLNVLPETLEMGIVSHHLLHRWTDDYGISPNRVVIEMTERRISDPSRFYAEIAYLKKLGFRIAVDDVGTEYSNLSMLADVVPDFIKFDVDFVRLTKARPVRQLLVESLVRFADHIGAKIVAEGIETTDDAETFRLLGVPLGQGYLYVPPPLTP